MSDERMTTSVKVLRDLWRKAKIEAVRRGITLSELVEKALRKELEEK